MLYFLSEALEETMANWRRRRLIEETSKLNLKKERALAEEVIEGLLDIIS